MSSTNRSPEDAPTIARVVGVKESLITVDATGLGLKKNEVGYIRQIIGYQTHSPSYKDRGIK